MNGIISALKQNEPRASRADVIFSTAHKAKGAQWKSVRLSEDFHNVWESAVTVDPYTGEAFYHLPDSEELALQYVAATRAETILAHKGLLLKAKEHIKIVRSEKPLSRSLGK
ncbi:MAG: hypothetical protein HKL81_02450 [Acidimicrobiaceae bacterium]|nr:hypothetical protein [Acidimicrobiaceae bacterium]